MAPVARTAHLVHSSIVCDSFGTLLFGTQLSFAWLCMREENALLDRENIAHPLVRPRPRSVTILRSQLPRNAPQLENWLALPFLRWSAFCNLKTPTAMHFNQCYELAASLFIHFRYVARNNLVYMHERWQADQFAISFNRKFQQFANATIDHNLADRANVCDQAILEQLLSSPANCNISSDMQRPAGPTSGSCNVQPHTGTSPLARFISLALLQSRRAGHIPSETIPAAVDSEQVEDTLSQTSCCGSLRGFNPAKAPATR